MSDNPFLLLGGAYDRAFQEQLLLHLAHCDNLLKLAAVYLKPSDFEIPVQRLFCEALLDYYTSFGSRPNLDMLWLQTLKVVQNSDRKYTAAISPEEFEALLELKLFLSRPGALSEDRFIAELGPYCRWIRSSRLVAQHQSQGGDVAELTQKLLEIEKQLSFLGGVRVQHRLSEKAALILHEVDAPPCVSTGLSGFDALLDGGIRRHELGMFTACPGVGKTNTLLHLALMSTLNCYRALYITAELEFEKIGRRAIAMGSGVPARYTKMPIKHWPPEYLRRVCMFTDKTFGAFDRLTICDLSGKTSSMHRVDKEIENWLTTTEKEFGDNEDCALVCIDWADKLAMPGLGKDTAEHLRLTKLLEELDHISHRYPVAIWTATQGTREADNRSVLMMGDTSGAYHKNDSLDIGVGIGIHPDDKIKVEKALGGTAYGPSKTQLPAELRLIFTINKNREGAQQAFNVYRAETLRLYNSIADWETHNRNIGAATSADLLWQVSRLQTARI